MRAEWKDLLHRMQRPLMPALGALPVLLAVAGRFSPGRLLMQPALLGVTVLTAWVALPVRGRWRLLAGLCGLCVITGATALLTPWQDNPADALAPLVCALLLLASLPMAAWGPVRELHPGVPMTCGALYLIVYGAVAVHLWSIDPAVRPTFDTLLLVGFLADMLLTMLAMGRQSLEAAAAYGKVPAGMRRLNRVLVLTLTGLAALLSAIPALTQGFNAAVRWLRDLWFRLIAWLIGVISPETASPSGLSAAGGEVDLSALVPDAAPSDAAVLLERIFMMIGVVLAVIALLTGLWCLGKLAGRAYRRIAAWLERYAASATEDYVDEVTSTLDEAAREEKARLRRLRKSLARTQADTPAARIRLRYQTLLLRHPEWPASRTARKTLSAEDATLYEKARYSTHEVSPEEADRFNPTPRK